MKTKRILVTGGAGFLGSHLCKNLLRDGSYVICLDNFYTGNYQNISSLIDNPLFEFLEHDITYPLFINVDEIYHLACPASPAHYQHDPIQTTKTSVSGSINILDLAKCIKAKVFLASTSEIYGNPLVHPQVESYWGNVNPIGPRSCYDEGKRCAESLFFDYYRKYDLKIKVARIFNTYGPYMQPNDGRVVSNFIIQSLQQKDITIYGDGYQTRTFCYVDDLINGVVQFMNSEDQFIGPVNMGSPNEITIRQLGEKIIKLTGSTSNIVYGPMPKNDPSKRRPDISLAHNIFGWEPLIQLDSGLKHTIHYFSRINMNYEKGKKNLQKIKYQTNRANFQI